MIETLTKIEPEFLTDEKIYAVFVKALLCDKQMVPQSGNCTSLQLVALGMFIIVGSYTCMSVNVVYNGYVY